MVRTLDPSRCPPPAPGARPSAADGGTTKKQSVLIVGLGLSGCVAAHFLGKEPERFDVTCFELQPVPGLYAHSVTESGAGQQILDMPLRAVSAHYYRNLFSMYRYLNVELEQTNYAHTVVDLDTRKPVFTYVNVCIFGLAIPLPFFAGLNDLLAALLILIGFLQFVVLTPWLLFWRRGQLDGKTLHDFVNEDLGVNCEFQHRFLYPILSTLLSCSYRQTQQYPASLIGEFMCAGVGTLFTSWHRVRGLGVYSVAKKLLAGMEHRCQFGVRVVSVAPKAGADGKPCCVEVGFILPAVAATTASAAAATGGGGLPTPAPGVGGGPASTVAAAAALSSPCPSPDSAAAAAGTPPTTTAFRTFDHVIIAVEPDVARKIVVTDSSTEAGRACAAYLNSTASFTAEIVAHRDATYLAATGPAASAAPPPATNGNGNGNGHATSAFSTTKSFSAPAAAKTAAAVPGAAPSSPVAPTPATGLTVYSTAVDAAAADSTLFQTAPRNASTTTANIAMLVTSAPLSEQNAALFETWNPPAVPPKHVVKRARMTRAVWTVEGLRKAESAGSVQGLHGVWLCGSWAARGVTLLEQATSSALDVVQDFGVKLPFVARPDAPLTAAWWMTLLSLCVWCCVWAVRLWWRIIGAPTLALWIGVARTLVRVKDLLLVLKRKQVKQD